MLFRSAAGVPPPGGTPSRHAAVSAPAAAGVLHVRWPHQAAARPGKLQVVTLVHCYLAVRASLLEITEQLAAVAAGPEGRLHGLEGQLHALRLIVPRTGASLSSQCPPVPGRVARSAGCAPGSSRQDPGPLGRGRGCCSSRRRLQRHHVPPVRLQWTAAHPSG